MKKSGFICLFFGVFLGILTLLMAIYRVNTAQTLGQTSPWVVVIDAGHGGEDGGAVSLEGAHESDINLAISLQLEQILSLYGIDTVMLRIDDVALSDPDGETVRERKTSDLENRVKRIEEIEQPLVISIHQNSFSQEKYYGAQVFYTPNSADFGAQMQEGLRLALDPENVRQSKAVAEGLYLMNQISCVGLLIECGFLTNQREAQKLETPEYQLKIAAAIATEILHYITNVKQT